MTSLQKVFERWTLSTHSKKDFQTCVLGYNYNSHTRLDFWKSGEKKRRGREKISGIVSPFVPTQLQTRLDGYSQKSLGSFVSCFRNGPKRNFRKPWKTHSTFHGYWSCSSTGINWLHSPADGRYSTRTLLTLALFILVGEKKGWKKASVYYSEYVH